MQIKSQTTWVVTGVDTVNVTGSGIFGMDFWSNNRYRDKASRLKVCVIVSPGTSAGRNGVA